ncbi:MAG: Gfo/Idh/MocA family oxidoreductase [Clostridia bacterium]|nr:Gfo/Idh/MocA family oxidoreductase [Clostridia bacterium]
MKVLNVILIGAGDRGRIYVNRMPSEKFKVVGVAEPVAKLREYIKETFNLPEEMCFESWEDILAQPKLADVAVISTMDRMHYEPTMKAIEKGYDILLEKPVSPDFNECVAMANAAKEKGTKVLVCHVLRYAPFFMKIKEMIEEGKIGQVLSVHHTECVGHVHQSHSFVRGNWGNSQESSCMILQKCCHDMDIIQWLVGSRCKRVHSFGSLTHFTEENAPKGAPERCDNTCPVYDTCYYNAVKLYLEDEKNSWFRMAATKKESPTNEDVAEALKTTQYGKCVYKCNNDVVDHQVVNLEFENGAVASFNMSAFNEGGRYIRVMGTDGELSGSIGDMQLDFFDFRTRQKTSIDLENATASNSIVGGHGGGDQGLMNALYDYITGACDGDKLSNIAISVENHLISFAAEKSRLENVIVDLDDFQKELGYLG